MKLAEALQERADLNKRIEQLRIRIEQNVVMQEGVDPVEKPENLFRELDACIAQLKTIIAAINRANLNTMVDGTPLTDLLAERDALRLRLSILRDAVNTAGSICMRSRGDEIRQLASVDVNILQKQVDTLSREYRLLDNRIQAANWTTDI